MGNAEQKPNPDRIKVNSASNPFTADRPICKISDSVQDGLPHSRESTNVAEDVKESSDIRQKQSGGKSLLCQKCKDIGHSAECCTVDGPQLPLASDITSSRSSKEPMDKGNRLKAAIEAAMLKKPGIYRRNRVPDQSDDVSATSGNCEASSRDKLLNASNTRNLVSLEVAGERESAWKSATDSTKHISGNNLKQFTPSSGEAANSSTGTCSLTVPADGKPSMADIPSHASFAASALLATTSAIPEHEYIWQ